LTELTLEAVEAKLRALTPEQRRGVQLQIAKQLSKCWMSQPGPQMAAYNSEADETLYGGAAGGGKSDLLVGMACTAHQRSIIFRRQANDLDKLWSRLEQLTEGRRVRSDSVKKRMRLADSRFIEMGHLGEPGSEKSHQGNDHDFYGFDEAAQLEEFRVAFVIQWLRSTNPRQRKRVVFATNPPIPEFDDSGNLVDTGTGAWLIDWFAPWLSDTYANPAQPGELRWCFMRQEGDRLVSIWVDGPGGYNPQTAERVEHWTEEDLLAGRVAVAKSRTFIRSLLKDNAFLKNTGYAQQLSATPEPLKSLLLSGSFNVKGEDHPMQVIPTQWVLMAQERHRKRTWANEQRNLKMLVLAGDIAQGGVDTTVLAPLYHTDYFGDLTTQPGNKTPTGFEVEQLVLAQRRNNALIVLDGTGGWAGSTRDLLWDHQHIKAQMCIASEVTHEWTPDLLYEYGNVRAQMWWAFRMALDPQSTFEICLPQSTRLLAQLTTPHFKIERTKLFVEEKTQIRKRLSGASTDEADAILMAWMYRELAIQLMYRATPDIVQRLVHGTTAEQVEEEQGMAAPMDDPLANYHGGKR
jgi:hypothetical protein